MRVTTALVVALGLASCGSIPDAQVTYYKAASKISVKVTRSVLCDSGNFPFVADTVAPSVVHFADKDHPQHFRLAALRGAISDSDIKFEFYEDGRLKSVNGAATGQGDTVLKAVTTLVPLLAMFSAQQHQQTFPAECRLIKELGGGKPISVSYEASLDLNNGGSQQIPPDKASEGYVNELKNVLPDLCARVKDKLAASVPVQYTASNGDTLLNVRQPGWIDLTVGVAVPGGCIGNLWAGRVPAAQFGTDYALPVPKPPIFGKQTFGVGFTEAGALTGVQYGSGSGAANAVGAITSLATLAAGETSAAKAAEFKAEADLIAQQQRLLQCVADPKSCK
jgi:hypothetical protein